MKALFVGLLVLCSSFTHAATDKKTVCVDRNSPTFSIQFPSNPTTGYSWSVTKFNASLFKLVDSKYIHPPTDLIGAGGVTRFTFALLPGQVYPNKTQMVFCYGRPWDPDSYNKKRVIVKFIPPITTTAPLPPSKR